jgi:C1A family cysteine protease
MNSSRLGRIMLSTLMTAVVLLMFGTFSYAEKLENVHKAIRDKGKHWVAGETENSRVPAYAPEYAQGRRIGLIKPKLTGTERVLSSSSSSTSSTSTTALPAAFDWSTGGSLYNGKNYVTPVRNQASCGSCWAFATTAALESYTLIQGGDSTCFLGSCDLSE